MENRASMVSRLFLLMGLVVLLPVAISLQMVRVGVIEGSGLRALWSSQAIDSIPIPAERGAIYDRQGKLLASNHVRCHVAIDPNVPGADPGRFDAVAAILASHSGRDADTYLERIRSAGERSRYVVLDRSVSMAACDELELLSDRSVIMEEQYKRRYHFGNLSAHMLGYVDHQMAGVTGLEAFYDEVLRGEDGVQQVRRDRANRIFSYVGAPKQPPRMGYSLITTIDAHLQAVVEEELMLGVEKFRAESGTAIVMEPSSGRILAMANVPDFHPNDPAAAEPQFRRNRAIADMIEPGSTFKLVTTLAALEQNLVDPEEWFDTPDDGRTMIYGQWMRDHNPLGRLTFRDAIAKSSNIVFSEVAQRIDADTFYQYARNMGFGTVTHVDLPNEMAGRLQKPYEWSGVTLPWMSIGYEVQVTPLQMLQAYAAFANGGVMMKPYVVEKVVDDHRRTIEETVPSQVRRIAKKETIEQVVHLFEAVLSDSGTASWAAVEGLRIAGKTGTAQKFVDGRYGARYRASFAGFFPVENPLYAVLVLLEEPKVSFYGGYTSGSVFREIASRITGMDPAVRTVLQDVIAQEVPDSLRLVPNLTGLTRVEAEARLEAYGMKTKGMEAEWKASWMLEEGASPSPWAMRRFEPSDMMIVGQSPAPGEKLMDQQLLFVWEPTNSGLMEDRVHDVAGAEGAGAGGARAEVAEAGGAGAEVAGDTELILVPRLTGLSVRAASAIAWESGLQVAIQGSGTIVSQFPAPGERMRPGRTISLRGNRSSVQRLAEVER